MPILAIWKNSLLFSEFFSWFIYVFALFQINSFFLFEWNFQHNHFAKKLHYTKLFIKKTVGKFSRQLFMKIEFIKEKEYLLLKKSLTLKCSWNQIEYLLSTNMLVIFRSKKNFFLCFIHEFEFQRCISTWKYFKIYIQ